MPLPDLSPVLTAFARLGPPPWQAVLRSTAYRLRPPRPLPRNALAARSRDALLASGGAAPRQLSACLCEHRGGPLPTIVLGGFVPDATEQVFLLRSFLLRQGSVYYLNYPRRGFSLDLACAQLDDLAAELSLRQGRPPVLLGVSFGAGVAFEWLRRARAQRPPLAGAVFVSPVAAAADLVSPADPKPATLLGRALRPYLEGSGGPDPALIERSRAIFSKMFEAGAQNREGLKLLMTPGELRLLHSRVMAAIQGVDAAGAWERVQALKAMTPPDCELCRSPVMVLYAEKESSVLDPRSPTRAILESSIRTVFPAGECRVVSGGESPVQHASLIFHCRQFMVPIAGFYRGLRSARRQRLAA